MCDQVKYLIVFAVLILFMSACRTHRTNLPIENVRVSFLGGNAYPKASNTGGFAIHTRTDTISKSSRKFDGYSPLKEPVLITVKKDNNLVLLGNGTGTDFILGNVDSTDNCNYDCKLDFVEGDQVSFTSSLALFRYWHGFSAMSGLPLRMRYRYYTLKIKKKNGQTLTAEWKYSVYKYRSYNSKIRVLSGDYCEDTGGGLTKLRID